MKKLLVLGIASVLLCLGGRQALAESVSIAPEGFVTTTVEGVSRAAFHFDVSSLADVDLSAGRAIYFEWTVSGVPSNDRSEYAIYAAGDEWVDAGDVGGIELSEDPEDTWDIEIRDYERAGGLIRLNVTGIVQAWLDEETPNNGLVFTTSDVSANGLGGQGSGARLVLR